MYIVQLQANGEKVADPAGRPVEIGMDTDRGDPRPGQTVGDTPCVQAFQRGKDHRVMADDQLRPFLPCLAYRLRRDIQGYQSLRALRFSIAY